MHKDIKTSPTKMPEESKKYRIHMETFYDEGSTSSLNPYLRSELAALLNEGHQIELNSISSIEGAIRILEEQLRQMRTAAGTTREFLRRTEDENKKMNAQLRLESSKQSIKKLARMKYNLIRLLKNKDIQQHFKIKTSL